MGLSLVYVCLSAVFLAGCSAVNVMEFDDGIIPDKAGGKPVVTSGVAMGPNLAFYLRDSSRTLRPTFDPVLYTGIRQSLTPFLEAGASMWTTSILPVFPVLILQQGDGGGQIFVKFGHSFASSEDTGSCDYTSLALKVSGSAYGVIRTLSDTAGNERGNGFTLDYGPGLTIAHDFRATGGRSAAVLYAGAKLHILHSSYEYGFDADNSGPSRTVATVKSDGLAYNPFIGLALAGRTFLTEVSALVARNPWTDRMNLGLYLGIAITR